MDIKRLQQHLTDKNMSRKHYNARLRDLFDDGQISKSEFEAALDFEPPETVDEGYQVRKTEMLEMMGLAKPENRKKVFDPAYAASIAEGLDLMGVKQTE